MASRALGVIPVRMDATRLPGKPLLRLDGRTIDWLGLEMQPGDGGSRQRGKPGKAGKA